MRAGHQLAVPDWENPAVYSINQRTAHVPLRSFESAEQALHHFRNGGTSDVASTAGRIASLNADNWNSIYIRTQQKFLAIFLLFHSMTQIGVRSRCQAIGRPRAIHIRFIQTSNTPGLWTLLLFPRTTPQAAIAILSAQTTCSCRMIGNAAKGSFSHSRP